MKSCELASVPREQGRRSGANWILRAGKKVKDVTFLMILRGPKAIWAPTPLFCAPVLDTVCELEGHESRVFKSVFSPVDDTLLATCSEDATCRLWDVEQGQELFCLDGHAEAVYSVEFSPDGTHVVSSGSDGKILIWDLRRFTVGEPVPARAVVQTIEIGGEAFAAHYVDRSTVACAIDDKIVLWDVEAAKCKQSKTITAATDYVFGGRERNPDLTPWIFCLEQYEPNGLLALGVSDATIRLLDADLKGTHPQKYPFQYPKVPFSNFLA